MTLYSEARLTRVMDGPTGTPIETYGFNDPSGSTRYFYNRFGDLTRKVQTTNGMPLVTAYGYDSAGRLATTTYPDGAVQDAGINRVRVIDFEDQ